MLYIALNIFLALIWMLLSEHPHVSTFVLGLLLSFPLTFLFRSVLFVDGRQTRFAQKSLFLRGINFIKFLFWFAGEFIMSNLRVAYTVLFVPRSKIDPHIIKIDVTELTAFEIVFLAQCITLTPGTTTIQISKDENILFMHALDARDIKEAWKSVEHHLKPRILTFTR